MYIDQHFMIIVDGVSEHRVSFIVKTVHDCTEGNNDLSVCWFLDVASKKNAGMSSYLV